MGAPWEEYQTAPAADAPAPAAADAAPQAAAGVGPWADYAPPIDSGPAVASAPNAMSAGPFRGYINANTGEEYNAAQQAAYDALNQRGELDRNATPGSRKFPLAQTDPRDLPKPGDWYVPVEGGDPRQVPPDPWKNTAEAAVADLGGLANPTLGAALKGVQLDPRWEAIKSGGLSGLLLGGKNEITSTAGALPSLFTGGPQGFSQDYMARLRDSDRRDANLRLNFPIAHDAAAVVGGVGSGLAIPEAALGTAGRVALNAGIGGASGALSTDGGWEDRAKGAAIGAVTGGLGGEILPRVLGAAPIPRTVSSDAYATVDKVLGDYGTSLVNLPPPARAELQTMLSRGAEPEQAAHVIAAKSLPTPIPLALGQVTGLPGDQLAFNMAFRGARGPVPAARAQEFAKGQQGAIRANVGDVAAQIAGGEPPAIGQGGIGASNDLNALYAGKKAGVDAAYDAARAQPAPALLPAYDASAIAGAVKSSLGDFDPLNIPRVTREVQGLANLSGQDVNLRDLFATRSRLSQLRASGDPVEGAAAGRAVAQMDRGINDALSADLFHGDPNSVQMWKQAIGNRAEFGQLFEQGDLVDRLTQRVGSGGQRRLAVDPGDAANYILGRSNLGFVGKQNLYSDLQKVRSLVTPDAWNSLRSEVFQRIASAGEGGVENGNQQFSGAKFLKAWNTANQRDGRLMETLFTPSERSQVQQLATVSARVTNPVRGGDNPSNTGVTMRALKMAGNGALHLIDAIPLVNAISHGAEDVVQRTLTARAMKGVPMLQPSPAVPMLPGRAAGYAGAVLAEPQTVPQR